MEDFEQSTKVSDKVESLPSQRESEGPAVPASIDKLVTKERFAERGQGAPLTKEEHADLYSWRRFPDENDKHYRVLDKKEELAITAGGKALTPSEQAALRSKREFPSDKDSTYRELAFREFSPLAPDLTPNEHADLQSKREFPDDKDSSYRNLAKKEHLAKAGEPQLTSQETKQLSEERADRRSKSEFPNEEDSNLQRLAKKEILSASGGEKLTLNETKDLQKGRYEKDVEQAKRYHVGPDERQKLEEQFLQKMEELDIYGLQGRPQLRSKTKDEDGESSDRQPSSGDQGPDGDKEDHRPSDDERHGGRNPERSSGKGPES